MELVGGQTIYRKRNTSKKDKQNPVYPYLLKNLVIDHPNQVCAIDITYVPMRRGFMYLCAVIDVHTRYVVNWGNQSRNGQTCCLLMLIINHETVGGSII